MFVYYTTSQLRKNNGGQKVDKIVFPYFKKCSLLHPRVDEHIEQQRNLTDGE